MIYIVSVASLLFSCGNKVVSRGVGGGMGGVVGARGLSMRMKRDASSSLKSPSFFDPRRGSSKYGPVLKKSAPPAKQYLPKTENQQSYVDYLKDPSVSIVLGVGPAGTGKTLFACVQAMEDLKCGAVSKIILTRPMVSVEEDLGFLPGSVMQKMDPWIRPIFDIFLEHFSKKELDAMVHSGVIEISPLAYMRGRTFKRSFIIADEMQNSTPNQMLMMVTRIGEGSKLVITGDLKQSDRIVENGLLDFMKKLRMEERRASSSSSSSLKDSNHGNNELSDLDEESDLIKMVEFIVGDVRRSRIVSKILKMYEVRDVVDVASKKTCIFDNKNVSAVDEKSDCALIPLSLTRPHGL
jgi:phosphate starvation-inducible PhoH-like protein